MLRTMYERSLTIQEKQSIFEHAPPKVFQLTPARDASLVRALEAVRKRLTDRLVVR